MNDNVVSVEWFERGRKHRYGRANPERFDEPVWEWMEREKVFSWNSIERFGIPWTFEPSAEPDWWFSRDGAASVSLGEDRCLSIGGKTDEYGYGSMSHNDVREYRLGVTDSTSELVAIYGYPREVFPGVCGATATLVGEYVYVIGGIEEGLQWDARRAGVYRLHLATMRMEKVETSGEDPGAIRFHSAELRSDGGAVVVEGGTRPSRPKRKLFRGWTQTDESFETFELCLRTHAWRLVEARAECFEIETAAPAWGDPPGPGFAARMFALRKESAGWRGRFVGRPLSPTSPIWFEWPDRGVEIPHFMLDEQVVVIVKKKVDRRWLRSVTRRAVVLHERTMERACELLREVEGRGESESVLQERLNEEYLRWLHWAERRCEEKRASETGEEGLEL